MHSEIHRIHRSGWLRAAVLGANDGIVSTASLLVGIASGGGSDAQLTLAGIAAIVAGALSMAAGEFVSVSSQADMEAADLAREKSELATNPEHEVAELTGIYMARGLPNELAKQVAEAMTKHDALGAHARDELGITETLSAKPFQAAWSSALSFALGASLPVLVAAYFSSTQSVWAVAISSTLFLTVLGIISGKAGGASPLKSAVRICFWGVLAMLATAVIGHWVGVTIA